MRNLIRSIRAWLARRDRALFQEGYLWAAGLPTTMVQLHLDVEESFGPLTAFYLGAQDNLRSRSR